MLQSEVAESGHSQESLIRSPGLYWRSVGIAPSALAHRLSRVACAVCKRGVTPVRSYAPTRVLQVLMWYLSHNQGLRDLSNRTDEFAGVQTYSIQNVPRWCAVRSELVQLVQLKQVRSAFQ